MIMASEAASQLNVPKQRLYELMQRGHVSYQRFGRSVLVDPELARRELEASGYYERSAKWRATRAVRTKASSLTARKG